MTWICIDEELPPVGVFVLVVLQGDMIGIGALTSSGFWDLYGPGVFSDSRVTHWQPRPAVLQRPAKGMESKND